MREGLAGAEIRVVYVARRGAQPDLPSMPVFRLLPEPDVVTLREIVESFFPRHVRRLFIHQ
jgi:hypothetical protein